MKIVSIRIKNLASLSGEHFIDFESQPLASSGLIAIVGKTGAGKSTILDAMCLTLFNKIPRLKDSDGKLSDVDGSELATNSPLTVLRRGTAHGFAELCFIAQDQKQYCARWEIKRAREKVDGKLQSAQRTLKCITDGNIVADKPKAVEQAIARITQLSFEQFTRAVLLAQSEVTAFLKARDNERGELLEYLTNSSIFTKVGQLAFEKTKKIAQARKELENILGHIELLSDEELSQTTTEFEHLNTTVKSVTEQKEKLSKQQQWFEQQHKLQTEVQTHQTHLLKQQQQFEALSEQRLLLGQLEQIVEIRPSLIQQKQIIADLTQRQPELIQIEQHFQQVEQAFQLKKSAFEHSDAQQKQQQALELKYQQQLEAVRTHINNRDMLLEQHNQTLLELNPLKNELENLTGAEQKIQFEVQQIETQIQDNHLQLKASASLQPLDDALSAHLHQLQRFIQSYTQFETQFGGVSKARLNVQDKQQQLNQFEQQFGQSEMLAHTLVTQRQQREALIQKLAKLDTAQHQAKHLMHIETERHHIHTQHQTLQQQLNQQTHAVKSAEQHYNQQKSARENLQQVLQQQRLLHSASLEQLRGELIEGQACLVCGSTHHPYQQNPNALSVELFNLQQQQEQQALQTEQHALVSWQNAQTQLTQNTTASETYQKQLHTLNEQFHQTQEQLGPLLESFNIHFDFSAPIYGLTQRFTITLAETQTQLTQVNQHLQELENVQIQCIELKQYIQNMEQQFSILKQAEDSIQPIIECFCSNDTVKQRWFNQTQVTANQLFNTLVQRQNILKNIDALTYVFNEKTKIYQQYQHSVNAHTDKIGSLEKRLAELKKAGTENNQHAKELICFITKETVEKPQDWLKCFDHDRQRLQHNAQHARDAFEQIRQDYEIIQKQHHQLKIELQHLEQQQLVKTQDVAHWLAQHPQFDQILLDKLITVSTEQTQQIRLQIQQAHQALTEAQSALRVVEEQLKLHLTQHPNIEQAVLQNEITRLNTQILTLTDQRDALKVKLEMHQRNIAKQNQYQSQIQSIQTEEHRWAKISGLMGDATGKKFRDYAQQYHLDILIEFANQQLALLSQRYTLKRLENSLSLAIIDHDMDGETRSVSSLSGGESFLTALALSLAIASMASGSMKIESLFIDEGFGTLDASSLHMVMNALDQLQSQGRKVVLISHIAEMHERIPVQIQVKPKGAGASMIEIVG